MIIEKKKKIIFKLGSMVSVGIFLFFLELQIGKKERKESSYII